MLNLYKCRILAITSVVRCEDSVVLIGIELDHMLTFNDHSSDICRKSARQQAVLKRLGHLLTLRGKIAIFKYFISSNFNYWPLIWHFFSQCNTNKLEKVQEIALRFVYNDYIDILSRRFSQDRWGRVPTYKKSKRNGPRSVQNS